MGRWRPPSPTSSPYITPAGYAALQLDLKEHWVRRRDVVRALAAAAAEGDRSENAEYIYRKKELAGIDRRIRYLQRRLPNLEVVRARPDDDAIYFGATVDLKNHAGGIVRYRIVGADEAAAGEGSISIDSPLARALLKKRVNDEVEVLVDGEAARFLVVEIAYDMEER